MDPVFYKNLLRPILFRLDPEDAHHLIHSFARNGWLLWPLLKNGLDYKKDDLACDLFGHRLSNPIGLAAGFDKNGDLVECLNCFGFGFEELGSVTALAREGNPKPRLFRLEKDEAVINRLGLNCEGADAVAAKLAKSRFSLPVGLNIAKTNDPTIVGDLAVQDILNTFSKINSLPLAYVTINASCPNTEEGIVTEAAQMRTAFAEIQKVNSQQLPILVKLSPDSSRQLIEEMVEAASAGGLAGFVCGNTTTSRANLTTNAARINEIGNGGLSGPPVKTKALQLCEVVYSLKSPSQIIIGCGGVSSGQDAYDFVTAGASFVQMYTGLIYGGPGLPLLINQQLAAILKRNTQTLQQAVGANHPPSAIKRG
jgi:dihydroorotate dehydrogenase